MANVKITDLTAIAAADVAASDVFVIDRYWMLTLTKKITKENLTTAVAAANDFVTYTQLKR